MGAGWGTREGGAGGAIEETAKVDPYMFIMHVSSVSHQGIIMGVRRGGGEGGEVGKVGKVGNASTLRVTRVNAWG